MSGTLTEYDPLGSTVTVMLEKPTMPTALRAGNDSTNETSVNNVARNKVDAPL
jgi:hypothetical protein